MNEILNAIGIISSIAGVFVTVSIFIIQTYIQKKDSQVKELLHLKEELSTLVFCCNRLFEYEFYQGVVFSETEAEIDAHIEAVKTRMRDFKNWSFQYVEQYDTEIIEKINSYLYSLEEEFRELLECDDCKIHFIYSNFPMLDKEGAFLQNYAYEYKNAAQIIDNTIGAFKGFAKHIESDIEHVSSRLEKYKKYTPVIDIGFDKVNSEYIKMAIDERKRNNSPF